MAPTLIFVAAAVEPKVVHHYILYRLPCLFVVN